VDEIKTVGDAISWILLGFGITFAPNIYFGGILFGLGCMMLVREFAPKLRSVPRRTSVLASIVVSTLAAIGQSSFLPDLSTTVVMAISGPLGVPIARSFASKSDQIAERLVSKGFSVDQEEKEEKDG